MIKNGIIYIYAPGGDRPIADFDTFSEISLSQALGVFPSVVRVKKKIISKKQNEYKFHFHTFNISLKYGSITASFKISSSAQLMGSVDSQLFGSPSCPQGHRILNAVGNYGVPRESSPMNPYWRVIDLITVRARLGTGGHKIIGRAKTLNEFESLISKAQKVRWNPSRPPLTDFIEDGITTVFSYKKSKFPIYRNNDNQILIATPIRGFRSIGVLGIVALMDDHQIIQISGGSQKPYFLMDGEIESPGAYFHRAVVVNQDCSGYWFTKVINRVGYITSKSNSINPLTFSDKAMIKLAISEYVKNL